MIRRVVVSACIGLAALIVQDGRSFAGDNMSQASRGVVKADLLGLAFRAQQFYWAPTAKGGGGRSFTGMVFLAQLTSKPITANGAYSLLTLGTSSIVLHGQGVEVGNDGNPISIDALVYPDSVAFFFHN